MNDGGNWLWPNVVGCSPNQYVQFRHEFDLPESVDHAEIRVGCDSNYALWVNDEFVDCGQYHNFPDYRVCDVLELRNLKPGKNVLAVLVYYQGEGSFQYIKGDPGLIYHLKAGKTSISSGGDALYRIDPNYKSGPIDKVTVQLGYTFEYNAGGADGWRRLDYGPGSDWSHLLEEDIRPAENWPSGGTRPVKKLVFREKLKPHVAAQGVFVRQSSEKASVAELLQSDFLSHRHFSQVIDSLKGSLACLKQEIIQDTDGIYLVLDLGREEVGLLALDLEAAAGTIIDIGWGEHLDDLRVRAHVGGRNFACRYICEEGRQSFTHYFTRFACRYLQLHFSCLHRDTIIHYAGLQPVEYPVKRKGGFICLDNLHNKIYDTCVRTLHLCMHEHYEDCPWREQALYAMDMRNQALAGYYCFREYDFPAASLDLLARSIKDDGFLELCAPAEIPITIPVFSFAWVLAVADHYMHSGNLNALRQWYPTVKTLIGKCSQSLVDGLLPSPCGTRFWHFYDWAVGLDGCEENKVAAFLCWTIYVLTHP